MATYYWVGGSGTWNNSNTTNWATSSGGAGGNGPPNSADTVIFDANSGTGTCTTDATAAGLIVTINSSTLTLKFGANFTTTNNYTLTSGTIDLDGYVLTCNTFTSNNSNTRSILFGSGNITLTGNNQTIWAFNTITGFTYTGTPTVNCTYSGGVGTRTINHGGTAGGTETNAVSFNISAGTDIIAASSTIKNLNFSGFSGTLTAVSRTIYGDLTLSSTMTINSGGITFTFAATSGTQKITSAGRTINSNIAVNAPGAIVQLQDNFTCSSGRQFSLTAGTLDLTGNSGNWTLSVGNFATTNTNTRSIIFGTGNITLTSSSVTIWSCSTGGGLTISGTPSVRLTTAASTGTRFIAHCNSSGGTEANAVSFSVLAGTDTVNFAGQGLNVDLTGFSGTLTCGAFATYGNVIIPAGITTTTNSNVWNFIPSSGTKTVTINSTLNFSLAVQSTNNAVVQLQGNVTGSSSTSFQLLSGVLDLTGNSGNWTLTAGTFAGSNSTTRSIVFGTGNITLTGSGTVWNTSTVANFSYTGTPTINISNNSATATTVTTGAMTEAQALNFNYTVGTYTLTDTSSVYKNVNFTGFTGTLGNAARTIYGNMTVVAGMTLTAGANATTFAATSGTQQITTNAKTFDFPLTFNGIGGTFAFQDALTQGSTRAFTITNGTVQLKNGVTSTTGAFATSGANQKFLRSTTPGSQATLSQASGTVDATRLTIQDINAIGGATWNAFVSQQNVDAGNNDGWDFGVSPVISGYEYTYQLRSFTQPRRF